MKKNYALQGMSCGGCVSTVKNALLKLPDVEDAEIYLHPQAAVITMSKPIDVEELQTQLNKAGHYTINEIISETSTT